MKLIKASDRLPVRTVPAILDNEIGKLAIEHNYAVFDTGFSKITLAFNSTRLYSVVWIEEEKPYNGALADALHSLADISESSSRDKDRALSLRIAYRELSEELRARAIRLQGPNSKADSDDTQNL